MPYVIAEACIDEMDKSCLEVCPVDCIYEGVRKSYVNPDECIDCGACESVCPAGAIYQDRAVPEGLVAHVADSRRFFFEPLRGRDGPLGRPGGSPLIGPVGVDTELVAGHPLRSSGRR